MTTDDERAAKLPDSPWTPVTPLRNVAAKLRRSGYGPVTARYTAAMLALRDVHAALYDAEQFMPEHESDGVEEPKCREAVLMALDELTSAMMRHLEIEARAVVHGRRRRTREQP